MVDVSASLKRALPPITVARRPLSNNPLASIIDEAQVAAAWQHVGEKIRAAAIETSPFALIRIDDVFPADFYELLVGQLPGNSAYDFSTAEDYAVIGNEVRRGGLRFDEPSNISRLPTPAQAFWRQVTEPGITKQLTQALIAKFRPHLEVPTEAVQPGQPVNIFGKWLLSRDLAGYELPPHVDVRQKLVAGLFYLPDAGQESPYGTTILTPKLDLADSLTGRDRYYREHFDVAIQVPFHANSFLAFVRSDRSFHGVDTVGPEVTQRNILMFNVNIA